MKITNNEGAVIGTIQCPRNTAAAASVTIQNNGTVNNLYGKKPFKLLSGTGEYVFIDTYKTGSKLCELLDDGCKFYRPSDRIWFGSESTWLSTNNSIVSTPPFTVKVNRNGTALTTSNGSYTINDVAVDSTVALSADFTPNEYGLTVDESKITSRWYYRGESKTAADGKALTLDNIQYGVYDLIFEASESTYGFATSVSVTVNVTPPAGKTAISLKTQLTSDDYTKVYDGTKKASEILPPIEFRLDADKREIRIPADCYTFNAEYASPDCISDNRIIIEVTLTEEGEQYYTLTGGKIEVAATITPYDGEWIDGKQEYKAFLVELNPDTIDSGGSASIGKQVLPYLRLRGKMYDAEQESLCPRPITSEDGFQYSFYHLRPGATEPDPELDELLTADSVFTYPDDKYHFYAVVEPSLNYTGCITDSNKYLSVYDKYDRTHAHDQKTYTFTVKNSGAKLKCFLLRKDTYTPLFEAFTPQ